MATTTQETPRAQVVVAWLGMLAMTALSTSVVGIVLAPLLVPAALISARRSRTWAVRVPMMLGALALLCIVGWWLAGGGAVGTRVSPSRR